MTKLFAGIDVSGKPNDGNYKFIAIIICTEEYLNSVRKSLGVSHIYDIPKNNSNRNKIASVLKFDNDNSLAICCRIDRADVLGRYRTQKNKDKTEAKRIYANFNRELFQKIREVIMSFIIKHKCELDSVSFECDGDSRDFTKDVGISHTDKGDVHRISDTVAWLCNNDRKLPRLIFKDLRDELRIALQ